MRTDNRRVHEVSENLKKLIPNAESLDVPPYDIQAIMRESRRAIDERKLLANDILFNLTGGTKPMAFAAYRLAEEKRCRFVYLQSEGRRSLLYWYGLDSLAGFVLERVEDIPGVITIDDYLKAHGLWGYSSRALKEPFEVTVYERLNDAVKDNRLSEIKPSIWQAGLQIDLVLRNKNQIGIAEVKTGRAAESNIGINQLNTASEQRYLGTFVAKFLILDRPLDPNNEALAAAHRIEVIVLKSWSSDNILSDEDRSTLVDTVLKRLGA
jgi:hypothetical protein